MATPNVAKVIDNEEKIEQKLPDGTVKVKLSRKIKVLGEETDELLFTEPTAWDLSQVGEPFVWVPGGTGITISCDYAKLAQMLCRIGSVPGVQKTGDLPAGVFGKQMRAKDLQRIRWAVQPFFSLADEEEQSSSSST